MNAEHNTRPMFANTSAGTEDIQLQISGRQKRLLALLNAPFGSETFEAWVAWIFGWPLDLAREHSEWVNQTLTRMNPDERWLDFTLAEGLQSVCKKLGLPCDTERHEQPYLVGRLFLLPLSGESLREYMTSPDDTQRPLEFLTPALWLLWFTKVCEIAITLDQAELPMEERMKLAIPEIANVGARMLAFAWPDGGVGRIKAFQLNCEYLESTSGLFDLDSGQLTDPDAAAMWTFLKGKG